VDGETGERRVSRFDLLCRGGLDADGVALGDVEGRGVVGAELDPGVGAAASGVYPSWPDAAGGRQPVFMRTQQ
jgi:hypothetical protein